MALHKTVAYIDILLVISDTEIMNNHNLAILAAVATVLFIVLNFTVENAGTLFIILAVVSGLASAYLFSKSNK
jgi:hypothetical protein